jgi:hypothetical protein
MKNKNKNKNMRNVLSKIIYLIGNELQTALQESSMPLNNPNKVGVYLIKPRYIE